jgi:hypothetical protein
MDALTAFGLLAVTAMLIFYALEDAAPGSFWRSPVPARSARSMVLQGAWPFGVVEAIWAGVATWRWRARRTDPG